MLFNCFKFIVAAAIICSGTVQAHTFKMWRHATTVRNVQYVLVPSSCGDTWVELRVDNAQGTVHSRKIEFKRERTVIKPLRDFPPIEKADPTEAPDQESIPMKKEEGTQEKPSILVMAGELPVVK